MSRGLFRFSPQQQQRQAGVRNQPGRSERPAARRNRARGQMQIAQENAIDSAGTRSGRRTPDINERLEKVDRRMDRSDYGIAVPGDVRSFRRRANRRHSGFAEAEFDAAEEVRNRSGICGENAGRCLSAGVRTQSCLSSMRSERHRNSTRRLPLHRFQAPTETEIQEELRIGLGNPAPQGFVDSLMGRLRNVGQGLSQQGGALSAVPVGNGRPPAGGGNDVGRPLRNSRNRPPPVRPYSPPATDASSIRRPTARFDGCVDDAGRRASAVGAGESCQARVMASVKDGKAAILATGPNGEKMPIAIMDNPESGSSRKNPLKIKRGRISRWPGKCCRGCRSRRRRRNDLRVQRK